MNIVKYVCIVQPGTFVACHPLPSFPSYRYSLLSVEGKIPKYVVGIPWNLLQLQCPEVFRLNANEIFNPKQPMNCTDVSHSQLATFNLSTVCLCDNSDWLLKKTYQELIKFPFLIFIFSQLTFITHVFASPHNALHICVYLRPFAFVFGDVTNITSRDC